MIGLLSNAQNVAGFTQRMGIQMKSERHEEELEAEIERLEKKGYRVINLEDKSPDAIAIKDGKVIAVEVLGMSYYKKKHTWKGSFSIKQKLSIYYMFDGVIIRNFVRKCPEGVRKPQPRSRFFPTTSEEGGTP